MLARFTRRPVIPVHVSGGRDVLPCGALVPRPGSITVRYGVPVRFSRGDTLASFAVRVQGGVEREVATNGL